jgi:RNA polymerase sigma-54 factor
MALEARLLQKLSQNLTMTPQLQQAIKLLQLGRLEYKEAIEQELLENPILEELSEDSYNNEERSANENSETVIIQSDNDNNDNDSSNNNSNDDNSNPDWDDYLDRFSDYQGANSPKGLVDHENRPSLEATVSRGQTLSEYLEEEIRFLDLSEEEKNIALYISGNLDKDGFLCVTVEELSEYCKVDTDVIEHVLSQLHFLEPIGLAAKDLKDCLLIQLDHQGLSDSIAAEIVRNHLDKIEKRKFDTIAKELSIPLKEVQTAIEVIQSLEPRPGRQFSDDDTRYVVPDIYVQKISGEWVVTLNDDGLPRLRISPYYLKVLQDANKDGATAKSYLNERLKAASWLIKSIQQRQQTILKVSESIIKFQKEFLEQGVDKLKPLVLKDVASDIGMHESTISRVTTNKFMHTPQGVFELKYFFTTGIKSATGDMSSNSIKERIKNLIAQENTKKPLSDQDIVELMQKENIDIARRTVAKYRESMNIPSSSQRKNIF